MSHELNFSFPLPNGLHARPASVFRDAANQFKSTMTLANRRSNTLANAKSALALVATLTRQGDPCSLLIEGGDEKTAFEAMKMFVSSELPHCDDETLKGPEDRRAGFKPRVLKCEGTLVYEGVPVSKGIVRSQAYVRNLGADVPDVSHQPKGTIAEEVAKIESAFQKVTANIRGRLLVSKNRTQRDIVQAHLSIAEDDELKSRILELVRSNGSSAGSAIIAVADQFAEILQQSGSAYLRERVLDIKDIARQLVVELYGIGRTDGQDNLNSDGILVAESLSPSQFIPLDKNYLKGIVLSQGGTTSHTVILARAFGIPCVTGVKDIQLRLRTGQDIILDAERGFVVPDPSSAVLDFYLGEFRKLETYRTRLAKFKNLPCSTADGRRIEVGANVGSLEEATAAFNNGAEGIGLFRTELLFMNRPSPPSEEEQFTIYAETAKLAGQRGVIVRTLDVGGDKPIPYLNLPHESNPFLGYRAIRMYGSHKEIIGTQFRAILRASAFGNLKIMFPMVSSVEEVRVLRQWIDQIMKQLDKEQTQYNRHIEIGIMVEIPSVAFIIDQLSREVDFFSIGSNDLTQYFLAVDRDNENVGTLFNSLHPSFLRLMKKIIDDAHTSKKWVGICGELGANMLALPLFVAYGIDEISLASPDIVETKLIVSDCRTPECKTLLDSVLQAESPDDVEMLLKGFRGRGTDQSLIVKELVRLDSESRTKDEAVRELVDMLQLAGRIEDPDRVEEAIWQREDIYSTGVGFQVAIPHCKSPFVVTDSIAVLKLKSAIEWKSLDEKAVKLVILIAINEDRAREEHLKMIAGLSRHLMDEEFRERMMTATEKTALLKLVNRALKIQSKR
jgi:fructose-specific PTS system IIA-like component